MSIAEEDFIPQITQCPPIDHPKYNTLTVHIDFEGTKRTKPEILVDALISGRCKKDCPLMRMNLCAGPYINRKRGISADVRWPYNPDAMDMIFINCGLLLVQETTRRYVMLVK